MPRGRRKTFKHSEIGQSLVPTEDADDRSKRAIHMGRSLSRSPPHLELWLVHSKSKKIVLIMSIPPY